MSPSIRRFAPNLLLAATLCAMSGCLGGAHNPSYFPFWLPPGPISQTHAKPPGRGNFAGIGLHCLRRPGDQRRRHLGGAQRQAQRWLPRLGRGAHRLLHDAVLQRMEADHHEAGFLVSCPTTDDYLIFASL